MKQLIILLFTSLIGLTMANAAKDRGGGDLCENRILEIADDISQWISKDGAKAMKFTEDITLKMYEENMIDMIDVTKVKCVKEGDDGYPVKVGDTPKVCRFDRAGEETRITVSYTHLTLPTICSV